MTAALQLIPAEEIESKTAIWPMRAAELVVRDDESEQRAARLLKDIKTLREEIASKCDPIIQDAHKLHKSLLAQKAGFEVELVEADKEIRGKMRDYRTEIERRAREEAARIEAESRKAREEAEKQARELEKSGEVEIAESIREEVQIVTSAPRAPEPAKVEGASYRDNWKAEVTDLMALVKGVAAGTVPIAAIQANTKVLGQQAKSLQKELKWPGVRVWNEKVVAVR